MSEIIEFNDNYLVFNLNWRELAGFGSEKKEIQEYAREINAVSYVRYQKKTTFCGFLNSQIPKGIKAVYSAAIVVAEKCGSGDAVLISNLGDGQYSLIAIRDGLPVPGLDIIGNGIDVSDVAREFISEGGERGITLFGDASEFFPDTSEFSFEDIALDPKDKIGLMSPIKADLGRWFLIGVLVLTIVGGYIGYGKWQQAQHRKMLQAQKIDPVKQYIQNTNRLLEKDLTAAPIFILNEYLKNLGRVPLIKATWMFQKGECLGDNCVLTWKRGVGTFDDFLRSIGVKKMAELEYAPDGSWIHQTIPITPPGPLAHGIHYTDLPTAAVFKTHMGSIFQEFTGVKIRAEIHKHTAFGQVPGTAIPPNVPGGSVEKGTWLLSGNYGLFASVLTELEPNMSTGLLQVELSRNNRLTFTLEGNYYVRK